MLALTTVFIIVSSNSIILGPAEFGMPLATRLGFALILELQGDGCFRKPECKERQNAVQSNIQQ